MWDGTCPACKAPVEFELWCDNFPCPGCGVMLMHDHECHWDEETGIESCIDGLSLAGL